jgi:hypothetical protein
MPFVNRRRKPRTAGLPRVAGSLLRLSLALAMGTARSAAVSCTGRWSSARG